MKVKYFYGLGTLIFSLVTVLNFIALYMRYPSFNWAEIASQIVSNCFNIALSGFFYYLFRLEIKNEEIQNIPLDREIYKVIKEVNKHNENKSKKIIQKA